MEKGKRISAGALICSLLFGAIFFTIVLPVKGDPGFLYGSSTSPHEWSGGAWTDYSADIDGSHSGDYLIIYTASYGIYDDENEQAQGWGCIKLVDSSGEVVKTKRFFEAPGLSGHIYQGTLVVMDKLTLNSEDVEARIYFTPKDDETIKVFQRSMIGIPLGSGHGYGSSTSSHTWSGGAWTDYSADIDGSHSGDYLIIYTASYAVTDPTGDDAYAWGDVKLQDGSGVVAKTQRWYEAPRFAGSTYQGTIVVADKLTLNSEDVEAVIAFTGKDDEKITVYERSMIAVPLESGYGYGYSTTCAFNSEGEGEWIDYTADIDGSYSGDYFIIYTASYRVEDPDWYGPPAHGYGWTKFVDSSGDVAKTTRLYEVPPGGGNTWGGTIVVADVLTLDSEDVEAKTYWSPDDNENIELCHRSMIAVADSAATFPIKITIQSQPTTDYYSRSHGMSIDEPLPNNWWEYSGYEFKVTWQAFTYEKTVYLTSGSHYVEYAASGYVPDYAWHAKIYINDVLKAEGDVGRFTHLRADFTV